MKRDLKRTLLLSGSKGKGGGSESTDTLLANFVARGIYVFSEGPVSGLNTTDSKSIYLNDVPLIDSGGGQNFKGVSWTFRTGLPDQDNIPGFDSISTPASVGTKVTFTSPVVVSVPSGYDAVKVIISIPALLKSDDSGNLKGTDLSYEIDVAANGGSYVTAVTENLHNQKCTTEFRKTYRVELPAGGAPWSVRLKRLTADSTDVKLENDLYFFGYDQLVDGKFSYRNTAVLGIEFDAQQFGQTVPTVKAKIDGIKVWVPKNYDPVTRIYATVGAGTTGGIWDGTFKLAFTNNPVWIYYDLVINNRYGLGQDLNPDDDPETAYVDKSALYVLAQYCDALVDNGAGGTEPRYTINTQIVTKQDAYQLLTQIATVFNGMVYFSQENLIVVADVPDTETEIFSQADVVDGVFEYTGSSLKTRHSVAIVYYNDPNNLYKQDSVVWEDSALIQELGYRVAEIQAFGCTSRAQAIRTAKWLVRTEGHQKQSVTFTSSQKGGHILPGDIVKIFDDHKSGRRAAGRVLAVTSTSSTTFTLDQDVTVSTSDKLVWKDISGGYHSVNFSATATASPTVVVAGTPAKPAVGASYGIVYADLDGALYRVVNKKEDKDGNYVISAVQHDVNKYAYIDDGVELDDLPTSVIDTHYIPEPTNLTLTAFYQEVSGAEAIPKINVSWTAPDDQRAQLFELQFKGPLHDYETVYKGTGTSWDSGPLTVDTAADYRVRIRTVGPFGSFSFWVYSVAFSLPGKDIAPDPPTNFTLTSQINAIVLNWDNDDAADFAYTEVWENSVNNSATASLIAKISDDFYIDDLTIYTTRYYWLKTVTHAATNNTSAFTSVLSGAARLITADDFDTAAPATPTGLGLTSAAVTDSDGSMNVTLTASWTANTESDLDFYILALQEGAGTFSEYIAGKGVAYVWRGVKAGTSYTAKILAVDKMANRSAFSSTVSHTTAADTTAPSAPTGVTATGGIGAIYLSWTNPTAADLKSVQIYENTSNSSGTATLIGTVNAVSALAGVFSRVGLATGVTRYYFLKALDTSGNASAFATVANATTVGVGAGDFDTTAPATPTSPSLTSALTVDTDGHQVIRLTASWTGVADSDLSYYVVALQEAAGSFVEYNAGINTSYMWWSVKANTSYTIKVLAVDKNGNRSSFTSTASHTSTTDSSAPSAPTGVTATAGITSIFINWTNATASDLKSAEVWENSTNTSGTATRIATVDALSAAPGSYTKSGIATGTQKFYWIKSVDTSGNTSGFSSSANATTATVATGDIAALAVTAAKIAANTITASQIAAGTITTTEIAAATIVASNIAAATITGAKIAANTITASNITAGTITATEIATSTINASRLVIKDNSNLIQDTNFTDSTFWSISDARGAYDTSTEITSVIGADKGIKWTSTGGTSGALLATHHPSYPFLVEPGKVYRLSLKQTNKIGFNGMGSARIWWLDQAGGAIQNDAVNGSDYRAAARAGSDQTETITGLITAPSNAYKAYFQLGLNWPSAVASAGVLYQAIPRVNRAINAELIVDGTITAAKITAGTITANEIAASTITGAKIAAATITASNIVSATITSTQIAAGTITASNIAAGTITANEIAATTITASRLVLQDNSSLIIDPYFSDTTYWSGISGAIATDTSSDVTTSIGAPKGLKYTASGANPQTDSEVLTGFIPVEPSKVYRVFVKQVNKVAFKGRGGVRVTWYTQAQASISSSTVMGSDYKTSARATSDQTETVDGQVTAPSNAAYAKFGNYVDWPDAAASAGVIYQGIPRMNRASEANLIVDGTIVAAKLSVSTLSAITADLGTITAGTINGGTISVGSGGVTIQSAGSGARIVMTNSLISVYDSSNVLRVRMGIW
jgi:predicted phage tail protein